MKAFKLLSGSHFEGGNNYKKGDIIKSPLDLATTFPNKFEEVQSVLAEAPAKAKTDNTPPPQPPAEVESSLGLDVTALYPDATIAKLHVFKKGSTHSITTVADPETPLNAKPLKASEIEPFIAEFEK